MSHVITCSAICILALALSACKQSSLSTAPGRVDTLYVIEPADSLIGLSGGLAGWVSLIDHTDSTSYYLADRSGTTVSIDSTGFRAVTDPAGRWAITDLHTGTYTISISKEGFGTYKVFGLQYVGGATTYVPGPIELGRVPTDYTISSLEIDSARSNATGIAFKALSSPLPNWVGAVFLVGRTPSVSSNPATYQLPIWATATANGVSTGGVPISSLVSLGFRRGDHVYVTAVTTNSQFGSTYWNPIFNVTVDPTMNPVHSNVISITLP